MKSDFTFSNDDAHKFVPWHVGIMALVAALLLCMMVTLRYWVDYHSSDYSGSFSVIIPGNTEKLDEKSGAVQQLLLKEPTVAEVVPVSENNMRKLLEPWIGNNDALSDIALPVVLDVTLKDAKHTVDVKQLSDKLSAIAPAIEIDSHEHWATAFATFTCTLQWLAALIAITIMAAMALIIAFSARASLHLHERAVNLLHSMGANDGYIAAQFQKEIFALALRGAAVGSVIGVVVFAMVGWFIRRLDVPTLPRFDLTLSHGVLLVALPLACATIALFATRISVLKQLKRVL